MKESSHFFNNEFEVKSVGFVLPSADLNPGFDSWLGINLGRHLLFSSYYMATHPALLSRNLIADHQAA